MISSLFLAEGKSLSEVSCPWLFCNRLWETERSQERLCSDVEKATRATAQCLVSGKEQRPGGPLSLGLQPEMGVALLGGRHRGGSHWFILWAFLRESPQIVLIMPVQEGDCEGKISKLNLLPLGENWNNFLRSENKTCFLKTCKSYLARFRPVHVWTVRLLDAKRALPAFIEQDGQVAKKSYLPGWSETNGSPPPRDSMADTWRHSCVHQLHHSDGRAEPWKDKRASNHSVL